MKLTSVSKALCLLSIAASSLGAHAVTDASSDFLPSYAGARTGDLDVLGSVVTYDPGTDTFFFTGTFAAAVGTTSSAFYVWGLDRGQGTERFNIGAVPVGAGVKFDSVVIFRLDGTTTVNRFTDTATVLTGALSLAGNTVSGSVAGALLPSTGFAKSAYTWNLWPRDGAATGNAQISDFAPDASNAAVAVVPEPQTWALLVGGLAGVGAVARRRRGQQARLP